MPPRLRNDLNGLRVRLPGTAPIYLIDLGKKRHIPNPQVYRELFSTLGGLVEDINIDDIPTGDPIPETALLFRCADSAKVFLLDGTPPNQVKRHIWAYNAYNRLLNKAGLILPDYDAAWFKDDDGQIQFYCIQEKLNFNSICNFY